MLRAVSRWIVGAALLWGAVACSSPTASFTTGGGGSGASSGGNGGSVVGGTGGTAGTQGPGGTGGAGVTGEDGGIGGEGGRQGEGTGGSGGPTLPDDSSLPLTPEQAWLVDDVIWTRVPFAPDYKLCEIFEGDPDKLRFQALTWDSCGAGCARADLVQGYGRNAAKAFLATVQGDRGEVIPLLSFYHARAVHEGKFIGTQRLVRLDTGESVGAYQLRELQNTPYSACMVMPNGTAYFQENKLSPPGEEPTQWGASFRYESKKWQWREPGWNQKSLPGNALLCTKIHLETGASVYPCTQTIHGQISPGSSELTLLDSLEEEAAVRGSSEGDLAVWSELLPAPTHKPWVEVASRIRGWTADGGIRTILERVKGDTCEIAVSPTHIAGASFDDRNRDCWTDRTNLRFWVIPRTESLYEGEVQWSPILAEGRRGALKLAVSNQHVAGIVSDFYQDEDRRWRLAVSRLSDWETRWIVGEANTDFREITLTSRYLYAVGGPRGALNGRFYEVVRYDLDELFSASSYSEAK